jgi:hypothetical protein
MVSTKIIFDTTSALLLAFLKEFFNHGSNTGKQNTNYQRH